MSKVFLVAVAEELNFAKELHGIAVHVCGVGKLNAAIGAFDCIQKGYSEIINIGSCGSLHHSFGEILKIGKVYQDIDARPICDYGLSPFETPEPFIELDKNSAYSDMPPLCEKVTVSSVRMSVTTIFKLGTKKVVWRALA